MRMEYIGLSELSGSLIALQGVEDVAFDEVAEITLDSGERRYGRVILIDGDRVVLQVFEGTKGISLENARTHFTGKPMDIALSREMLGRVFDGAGRPIDGLGEIYPEERRNINGSAINPVSRQYPRSCIYTGISAIDGTSTLIRGQKLPIFSGSGMKHNELAAQIVRQARVADQDGEFAIVFAAMGVKNDTAEFFRRNFEEAGALQRVTMFVNLASDPIIERILTPRCALTAAEYLAFDLGYHVLVIMTDMTSYCEAVREFSSSKGEIPSRKGFPSYLYSDLASLYERAGMIHGKAGSVTQVPVLTMPNDDITHPIPDLTGYITEGQIVLDRDMDQKGIYPPIAILPSLSRLMKDGIGKGFTRDDHPDLSNQLFASYSKVQDARSLASVIGEDELSDVDKQYLEFGKAFEALFVNQDMMQNRTIDQTLDLGWKLLSILPKGELDRISSAMIDAHYVEGAYKTILSGEVSGDGKLS
ncbi:MULTISPECIES: V-type ATP synthase subunit B [Oscillospiraceae]|uniref:V-type ATP synthase beta chain n=1 Tax=Lawsonibacter faecis TaxID=2763052 RepID=A0A8J6MD54_9FIRM|nr:MULTISPECIES: V-type ATP synthase subunit B [Oscillospiraceae]MTQ96152.1 V-type ATP synthase subunit B [Pseudoflavonifractor sp. BIOML-A16]MTR06292.1 V-type ATP synthase subunit B [Pseudoflavonifractor sp. BIOML-A15]MTR33179.1 V-type ATP synthase subunit B [Pseudoflavonifractor sp. BIOML-A14]MTR73452.1 V-type ATP synthase subunit B [Pseudoflavonifractor sp. BIOML-A18]MTS63872.1 V-type ATP synthase subunit B [Pseudoflavonifractor sp. BIOML-A5]MTS72124.1 V-type ATP synthase subunit B [Pseudo